ncbi:MAG: indoleamine 2,3-dioxygenase [Anaerolineales bacterium]
MSDVMNLQATYHIFPDRGFLPHPDPLVHLSDGDPALSAEAMTTMEALAELLPNWMAHDHTALAHALQRLPSFDVVSGITQSATLERLFMLYAYLASAAIHGLGWKVLPAGVAVPFYELAQRLQRPPILSYTTLVLHNWRRVDPCGALTVDNLAALQTFGQRPDEAWFALVHVGVEAAAALAIWQLPAAIAAAENHAWDDLESCLNHLAESLSAMRRAFHRMPEGCDPDVYWQHVRPHMFGFQDVVFEGVAAYGGAAQTLNGGSGAQSSIIPAIYNALGIQHQQTGLMVHLNAMKAHMPAPHRAFIDVVRTSAIREAAHQTATLRDAYNTCIDALLAFRRAHLSYAKTYIFNKTDNPVGTGGTPFMDWLRLLIEETDAHRLPESK